MTPNSPWRLIGVALLLVGSCWPAYGQTTLEVEPTSESAAAQAVNERQDFTYRLVAKAAGASEDKLMSEEDTREAIDRITERLNQNPNDIESLVARAGARMMLGDIKEAQADLTKAIKIAPNSSTAWYVYAQTKIGFDADTTAVKEGIAALKKAHDLGFDDPELFCMLGVAWHQIGDTRRALDSFSKAIDMNVAKAYFPRAMLRSKAGDTLLAIADFDKVIELGAAARVASSFAYCERGRAHHTAGNVEEAISDYTKVIDQASGHIEPYILASAHIGRAQLYDANGKWDAAIRDFNRGIELEPTNSHCVAFRGCAYIEHGEFEKGIADIRKAIELNPGDLGANYHPLTDKALSPEALAHGDAQVRKMLKDRPLMAKHVIPGDLLWTWAVRKFAGEDLGQLIDWNAAPPIVSRGQANPPEENQHASIQVAERPAGTGEESALFEQLWSCAVFELNNVANSREILRVHQGALRGDLTCDQYVEGCINSEQPATQRTRAFYLDCYLVWLKQRDSHKTDPSAWYCNAFVSQLELANIPGSPHPRYYSFSFYRACIERELNRGNQVGAKVALAELLKFADVSDETKRISKHYSGHVNLATGNLTDAIADFSAAISGNDRDVDSILGRGIAYSRQGDYDKALADFNHALLLKPEFVEALAERSDVIARRGDKKAAEADLEKAIQLAPNNPALYVQRGFFRSEESDENVLSAAIADFSKAIELNPNDSDAYQGRAHVLRKQGKLDKAIADLDAAIRIDPNWAIAYLERGICRFENREWRGALDDYNQSIKIVPDSQWTYAARAKLRLESDDVAIRNLSEALSDAKRSCELSQWESPEELSLLAGVYAAQSDFDNAIKWQEKAVSLSAEPEKQSYATVLEGYKQRQKERK